MITTTLRFMLISAMVFTCELASAQIPNNGFELWSTVPTGNLDPAGWETTNDDPDVSVEHYTPAKAGAFSIFHSRFHTSRPCLPIRPTTWSRQGN